MARFEDNGFKIRGRLAGATIYERDGQAFIRPSHIIQPHRLSRKQLVLRERLIHNNILWRVLKPEQALLFEPGGIPNRRFMKENNVSPTVYLSKQQAEQGFALLLPDMLVSDGTLPPVGYALGVVGGQQALLTDIPCEEAASKGQTPVDSTGQAGQTPAEESGQAGLLLCVVRQEVVGGKPRVTLEVEECRGLAAVDGQTAQGLTVVDGQTAQGLAAVDGRLVLLDERLGDPMAGFALVRVQGGRVSRQRIVTACDYYLPLTTEEALQCAAKSYDGLTGED